MVGYILGLGDRHPNNLMINRNTGKVVHIDFGDCFEVAMHRDKFAEKVPFRLTRMLVNAMEVSGIEGNFRTTCEAVMKVMRENKESMMAVLEAVVYDPLINWRLITNPSSGPSGTKKQQQLVSIYYYLIWLIRRKKINFFCKKCIYGREANFSVIFSELIYFERKYFLADEWSF